LLREQLFESIITRSSAAFPAPVVRNSRNS
jgi:hypothetical protein